MEVHRCRFVEFQPAAINALDFTPSTVKETRLAVGRADGSIEIWDPHNNFRFLKVIPGGKDLSVESLVWAHQSVVSDLGDDEDDQDPEEKAKELNELLAQPPRLFSSGLSPYIVEWDPVSLTVKETVDSNGGAVWCLAVNSTGTRLAAGCEDGRIRLFDIEDGRLDYMRSFAPQNGRVLSLAWGPEDDYIISGGSDSALRKWNAYTGETLLRMTVDRANGEPTLVWSVAALKDNTFVSGDSLGNLMFWNGDRGTMKQTIKAHAADILTLTANKEGTVVVTSGVDCKIMTYQKVEGNLSNKNKKKGTVSKGTWANVRRRRNHWHDVRALAIDDTNNIVVSGGVDVGLVAGVGGPLFVDRLIQVSPFPEKYIVSLAKAQNLVMGTFFNSISLWRLGKAEDVEISPANNLALPELLEQHKKCLELQLKPDCNITSSSLSDDGQWIVVADVETVRLFQLYEMGDGQLAVKKMRTFDQALARYLATNDVAAGAHHVLFTPGSNRLVIVTVESRILVVDMLHWKEDNFDVVREFGHHRGLDSEGLQAKNSQVATVISITASSDGQWLATGDDANRIHVFNLDSLKHHIELPHSHYIHTALSFNDFRPNELFVGLANNEFHIYNVEKNRLTNWSKAHTDFTGTALERIRDNIKGVAYNPAEPKQMMIYGNTFLCLIQLTNNKDVSSTQQQQSDKRQKRKRDVAGGVVHQVKSPIQMQVSNRYQQILFAGFKNDNSLVLIERPRFSVLEKLPPSFYKSRYGA
ncbi:quinon protein alcohol dehydrogenase-like superfamily [Circinella umbellata]|nr:quinon protein alcohol dehydrogenase-like superfamily [Circinella umbellata]